MSNPSDLNIVTQADTDKNYFNFKATGLKIDKTYAIKFQWVYEDGTVSEWSAGKFINTVTESVPAAVTATVPSSAVGNIPVTLPVFPPNTKRVDIYIIGGVYGAGKVADSFFASGTKNIPVAAGEYIVSLIAVSPSGINGTPTNLFNITISNVVTEDTTAPDQIASGIVTGGVNPQFSGGRLGYLNVAVTNSTIPADFAGYIVKIVSSTNTWTQEFASSTALSNLYITSGVFVGQAYTLSVATTDGKNISNYVNCTPAPFTVTDTRANSSTVTGSLSFSATDSILTVSWAASADAYVDSYRVQITLDSDTTFTNPLQTVESKGTTVSFGGLTSSTAYRVRVTTRYSGSNALSTNHTTGTVTLNSSGAISDGNVPTKNPGTGTEPAIVVKPLFKAFTLNWSDIDNPDEVTYEVYVKTVNSTGIVDPANLVMEINGTFAVINSLKDGTAIAYPAETSPTTATNYYFAVRAKDADGVSSAAVTPVGPFTASRTGQFDIATNAIYANHITAGEITADKMTTDLLFVNKTINVGESTSLNRIRLASSIATPVIMTDPALASPSTYSVKSRIFIGAGNYYSVGTPFYADNTGRFSLANKLRFDGTNLLIDGSGTFSGTVTAGSGPTVSIGTDVQGTNDGIYISGTGDYIYADGRVRLGNGGITYAGGVLTVSGAVTATSIASGTSISGTTGNFTGSITGASGTFGGALDVGTASLANITGASRVTINDINGNPVTRVRFIAQNNLKVNDSVTISGIAQNQTFAYWAGPGNTNPVYNYSNNPFNLGTVAVYEATSTYFDIQSSVTGTYTSGGTANASAFRVTSTGLVRAAAGQIGGWDITAVSMKSNYAFSSGNNISGTGSFIEFNPVTPRISLTAGATITNGVSSGGNTIRIDPISGIVGPNVTIAGNTGPGFSFSPDGTATLRGAIYATTGVVGGWSLGTSTLTGGTLTLNSSGTITSTGSVTGFIGTPINVSSTLSSGRMQTVAGENTIGYFGSTAETGFSSSNNTNITRINPNGISIQSTSEQLGVGVGGFTIQNSSGDYAINFVISGANDANGLTSRYIQFVHWASSAQVTKDNAVNTFDTAQSGIRRLVIYQGTLYTGETQYFSTTQTTTPSTSIGLNGDLFYSTA
jgi:hypothetical protein